MQTGGWKKTRYWGKMALSLRGTILKSWVGAYLGPLFVYLKNVTKIKVRPFKGQGCATSEGVVRNVRKKPFGAAASPTTTRLCSSDVEVHILIYISFSSSLINWTVPSFLPSHLISNMLWILASLHWPQWNQINVFNNVFSVGWQLTYTGRECPPCQRSEFWVLSTKERPLTLYFAMDIWIKLACVYCRRLPFNLYFSFNWKKKKDERE